MRAFFSWFVSDESLPIRIAIGLTIFATLAIVDYVRHRERATRWREYAFLFSCVLLAITYGILNDLITSRISIEYFLYGKGVGEHVSAEVLARPEAHRRVLDLHAVRIGAVASWSVGLIAGAALLVTNTVGRRPRLTMRSLAACIWPIVVLAITCAVAGGLLGARGAFTGWSADFNEMVARDEMRPYRFMSVFGIHLGGYVGAAGSGCWWR